MGRRVPATILLALVVALLAGCGSSPPPARSAANEISDAERAIDSAKQWDRKGEVELALGEYNRAKDIVAKGMSFAEGTERAKLSNMEDDIRGARMKLEMTKLTMAATPKKKEEKAAVAVKTEDPEEKKKKEEDVEKKKKEAKAAAAQADIKKIAELTAATTPPAKKAQTDEPEPLPDAKAAAKGEEKAADPDAGAIKKSAGPFPALSEKSPAIQVCKLEIKGKYAICYFQVFNAAEAGKRIMSASVYFKDGNNSPMINPLSAPVYPFEGFKATAADPIGGQMVNALSLGSQQVTGGDGLRLVGVGESDRAKDIKSVAVKVVYGDGTTSVATSSTDAAADVPGLKALDQKK